MNACSGGDGKLELVNFLLSRGANPKVSDNEKFTALAEICWFGLSSYRAPKIIQLLLDQGLNPNALCSKSILGGRHTISGTPLTRSCEDGDRCLEVAKLLLKAGADQSIKNNAGETALTIAEKKSKGATQLIKLLKEWESGKE